MVDINPQIIEAEIAQIGPQGIPGQAATITIGSVTTGAAGSSATVTNSGTSTAAVLDFVIPQGAKGAQGEQGQQGIQGLTGATGNGISSIAKIGTSGLVDTYRISLTDNTYYDFTVTNGSSISDIEKTGTSGLVDTYTITLTNGNTHTFTVTNGAEGEKGETGDVGNGILNILKMSTTGLVDNYRINFTNGTYFDFDVTNALSIQSIAKLSTSGLVDTYRITFNDSTYFDFPVTNGKGVTGVTLLSWEGLDKTYRMSFNDGTYFDYVVTNGTGQVDWGGITGILSQQADLQEALDSKANMSQTHALKAYSDNGELLYDAEGLSDVTTYAHSSFDISKFTVVGSPIVTSDGIASGFSDSNYLTAGTYDLTDAKTFKFNFRYKLGTYSWSIPFGFDTVLYLERMDANSVRLSWVVSGTQHNVQTLTNIPLNVYCDYEIEITSSNVLYCRWKTLNNNTWSQEESLDVSSIRSIGNSLTLYIGKYANGLADSTGSIDLKQLSITVDGVPVFSGNRTGIDTIKPDDYTAGSASSISDDGIASGFTVANSSIETPTISLNLNQHTTKLKARIKENHLNTTGIQVIFEEVGGDFRLGISTVNGAVQMISSSGTAFYSFSSQSFAGLIPNGAWYDIEIIISATTISYKLTCNGNTYSNSSNISSGATFTTISKLKIGRNGSSYGLEGDFDLNAFQIFTDGDLVYQPCLKIPYTSGNFQYGGKYVNAIYRPRVQDAFEQGLSNEYFTLQEDNVPNYTVVGSPVVTSDFVASGFSSSNYVTATLNAELATASQWRIEKEFTITSTPSASGVLFNIGAVGDNNFKINLNTDKTLFVAIADANSTRIFSYTSSALNTNTSYKVVLRYDANSGYYLSINGTETKISNSTTKCMSTLGVAYNIGYNLSTCTNNLNADKIYIGNNLAYQAVIPPCFTLPTGQIYGRFGRTLRNSYRSGANYAEIYSDRTQELGGTCTSGTEITFYKGFASENDYVLSVPYQSKTATSFVPSVTGDWIAKGIGAELW